MREEQNIGQLFLDTSRERLRRNTPKLFTCLSLLSEEEVWKRSNPHVNSVGNLILHLCGNVRQWIISGIGGAKDIRQRPQEFRQDVFYPKAELIALVENTIKEADQVLAHFNPELLGEVRIIQGFRETCLQAIYSSVEHWSHHTGQIIHITKGVVARELELTHLTPEGYNPH
jgi:uncharacterized damage-inducible protein DinB